jgi:hypothetical protein
MKKILNEITTVPINLFQLLASNKLRISSSGKHNVFLNK